MSGFDPGAQGLHTTTLTTRPLWFLCEMVISFKT